MSTHTTPFPSPHNRLTVLDTVDRPGITDRAPDADGDIDRAIEVLRKEGLDPTVICQGQGTTCRHGRTLSRAA